jgi:hypothetical protein
MIAYDLQCTNGHRFEGWFDDAEAFESQGRRNLVACPVCDSTDVTRLPSAFSIKGTSRPPAATGGDTAEELKRKIVDIVEKNFDNVGANFATEALKMHYGIEKPRNIRGVSTQQEEQTLRDEGIEFFKIPLPAAPDTPDTDA